MGKISELRSVKISEWLADIFGEEKGARLKKAIESIRRKVSSDFRRPIKQAQLNEWLQNLEGATKKRNERIDKEVEKFSHKYFEVPSRFASSSLMGKPRQSYEEVAKSFGKTFDE